MTSEGMCLGGELCTHAVCALFMRKPLGDKNNPGCAETKGELLVPGIGAARATDENTMNNNRCFMIPE